MRGFTTPVWIQFHFSWRQWERETWNTPTTLLLCSWHSSSHREGRITVTCGYTVTVRWREAAGICKLSIMRWRFASVLCSFWWILKKSLPLFTPSLRLLLYKLGKISLKMFLELIMMQFQIVSAIHYNVFVQSKSLIMWTKMIFIRLKTDTEIRTCSTLSTRFRRRA